MNEIIELICTHDFIGGIDGFLLSLIYNTLGFEIMQNLCAILELGDAEVVFQFVHVVN